MTKPSSPPAAPTSLEALTLGKTVSYDSDYCAERLQAVPRSLSRDQLGLSGALPFRGEDIWNGYELSWLNPKGKPQVGLLQCRVPYDSPNLIESKSFKLYLNGFNQHKLASIDQLQKRIQKDLSVCAGKPVSVTVIPPEHFHTQTIQELGGDNLDELDVTISCYQTRPEYLSAQPPLVEETLTSNLLKSNCLITNQPDWASLLIRYQGNKIDHPGLLKYLISFRQHNEFHEQCVERIFCDIMQRCQPDKLTVFARYTRRGGLDINPFRSNFETTYPQYRHARQ